MKNLYCFLFICAPFLFACTIDPFSSTSGPNAGDEASLSDAGDQAAVVDPGHSNSVLPVFDGGLEMPDANDLVSDGGGVDSGASVVVDAGNAFTDAGSMIGSMQNDGGSNLPSDASSVGGEVSTDDAGGPIVDPPPGDSSDAGPLLEAGCQLPLLVPNLLPQRSGRFAYVDTFPMGDGLLDRRVRIYLPLAYDQNPTQRFSVLYMHDGQNLFDPGAPFGEWQVDETIDALVAANEIEPLLVVAIDNSPDRMSDYTFDTDATYGGGNGDAYLQAVVQRIKPWVDHHFRTQCEGEQTGLIGSSLGGLISFRAVETYPEIFGRVACVSSSFWWNDNSVLPRLIAHPVVLPRRLWIDGGNQEGALDESGLSSVLRDNRAMVKALLQQGAELGDNLVVWEDLGGQHNEPTWAQRLPNMLRYLWTDRTLTPENADWSAVHIYARDVASNGSTSFVVQLQGPDFMASAFGADTLEADASSPTQLDIGWGRLSSTAEQAVMLVPTAGTLHTADVVQFGLAGSTAIGLEVQVPANTERVQLSGNLDVLTAWAETGVPLSLDEDGLYRVLLVLPRESGFEYKYHQGSWSTVEKGAADEELANRAGYTREPLVRRDEVLRWAESP